MRRRLALALLRLMLRISTPGTHPWAEAMLAEASYVEGGWAVLFWSLGSSGVLLKRAVTDRLARPEEDLMQRPRLLFSTGFTFLLIAALWLVMIAPKAYTAYTRYRTTEATITSVESRTAYGAGTTAYFGTVHLQCQYRGANYTPEVRLLTRNPLVRDQWARQYPVGRPYSFMFDRQAPELPVGSVFPPGVHRIRIIFLACLGSLVISGAMVYVGKKKAI